MLGSEKEFVITKAWTHSPGDGTVYRRTEPSVIPLSYSGAPEVANVLIYGLYVTKLQVQVGNVLIYELYVAKLQVEQDFVEPALIGTEQFLIDSFPMVKFKISKKYV